MIKTIRILNQNDIVIAEFNLEELEKTIEEIRRDMPVTYIAPDGIKIKRVCDMTPKEKDRLRKNAIKKASYSGKKGA